MPMGPEPPPPKAGHRAGDDGDEAFFDRRFPTPPSLVSEIFSLFLSPPLPFD